MDEVLTSSEDEDRQGNGDLGEKDPSVGRADEIRHRRYMQPHGENAGRQQYRNRQGGDAPKPLDDGRQVGWARENELQEGSHPRARSRQMQPIDRRGYGAVGARMALEAARQEPQRDENHLDVESE